MITVITYVVLIAGLVTVAARALGCTTELPTVSGAVTFTHRLTVAWRWT